MTTRRDVMKLAALGLSGLATGCVGMTPRPRPEAAVNAFLDDVQRRAFQFFWDTTNPANGLARDRYPTPSFASMAAVGFALTAYPIGVHRRFVSRAAAAERTLATLRFLANAPQGDAPSGMTGHKGFFYHFVDMERGARFEQTELSTVDTALLLGGILFAQGFFDQPAEREIRDLADRIYARVDWRWSQARPPTVALGWSPEKGHLPYDWIAYSEAMLVYLLALGSPTHALGPQSWQAWSAGLPKHWGTQEGQQLVRFGPLFGHQYSHIWVDFRGIRDAFMREKGLDYFENSRRATLAQHAYALRNPMQWKGYGPRLWGLTACDGPADVTVQVEGRTRTFRTYSARGPGDFDDGTIAPTAVGGSVPFAPDLCIPTLMAMRADHGDHLYGQYGFLDSVNLTVPPTVPLKHGRHVPGRGWYDGDYLGIDQGPILAMIENHRSGLIWDVMRSNAHIRRGLQRAGFTGGWLA
ncbi:glucoamylase family protein [Sphingomonas sp.]|uniref:glucoamylase family protein n=1 Tax=Sphingomonas sp. TaxID=28214 RepID=UPI0025FCCEEB|nr:glucoamylase family protein [Sphingomonas sp.]